ncbi:hypothetical protein CTI12_AA077610 [Artemisia annua]|uniref:Helitron helicase-like domain-containing protein n=1 Tax=Artemisia annua TaxID=35608 RepID=A0A2U1Q427_ARTAN|nr:hypothetical protein CTI12_AA077610 [Artemisia annua]
MHCAASSTGVGSGTLEIPHLSVAVRNGPQSSASALQTPLEDCQQAVVTSFSDSLFHNPGHLTSDTVQCINPAHFLPVQITAIDGSVSTFIASNSVTESFVTAQQSAPCEGSHNAGTTPPETATPTRRRSRAHGMRGFTNRQRTHTERPHMMDVDASPAQGPLAPPQREGAPLDYMCFGRCDQVCEHCRALFWLEEKKAGMPASAPPQYQKCCAVRLFRTARDKLLEADIPNFQIRLFGVIGANQYELPTADTIGAIVYEGGPESMTDYDVIIERHSREPESVNKLHPTYMALQFPLLFIYGEEGYHLNLILRNLEGSARQEEKKMTMKVYYAYQLCDRVEKKRFSGK